MRPFATTLLVAALGLALVGCAGRASAQPVETNQVAMPPSYRFDPPKIHVKPGTTVTWTNKDNFTHSVSVAGGGYPYLNLPPGQVGSITFDKAGTFEYVCTYHPQDMKGTVIVG